MLNFFSYDHAGMRIRKNDGSVDFNYVRGADGKDEAVVPNFGTTPVYNVFGNDNVGQVKRNSTTLTRFYYLKDHLGSIRVTVNSGGAKDSYQDFYPFGMVMEQRSGTGTAVGRYTFTGHEKDVETGRLNAGARTYFAEGGKWDQVDLVAEKYPALGPYNYAMNDPINNYDPDGKIVVRRTAGHIVASRFTKTEILGWSAAQAIPWIGFGVTAVLDVNNDKTFTTGWQDYVIDVLTMGVGKTLRFGLLASRASRAELRATEFFWSGIETGIDGVLGLSSFMESAIDALVFQQALKTKVDGHILAENLQPYSLQRTLLVESDGTQIILNRKLQAMWTKQHAAGRAPSPADRFFSELDKIRLAILANIALEQLGY